MRRLSLLLLAGCASGARDTTADAPNGVVDSPMAAIDSLIQVDAHPADASLHDAPLTPDAPMIDAAVMIDAAPLDAAVMIDAPRDAPVMIDAMADAAPMIDAMTDAAVMVDAAPMIDAGCTPSTTELLTNPAFDGSPQGTGWTENSGQSVRLITDDVGTPAAQSTPYRAWLGGFDSNSDALFQNVTIPANTTKLEITGFYAVGTGETSTTLVFDTGDLALATTAGTIVEDVLPLSNLSKTTIAWTPLDHVFTMNLSGQTLQVRMTATGDFSNPTSFFFDTLSLKATHCP